MTMSEDELRAKAQALEDEVFSLATRLRKSAKVSGRSGLGSRQNRAEVSAMVDQGIELNRKLIQLHSAVLDLGAAMEARVVN
jgi:ribosomal protein L9